MTNRVVKPRVIIPCYNEQETIYEVVSPLLKNYDVTVVDDNSSDNSKKILRKLNVRIIENTQNHGYDRALFIGIKDSMQFKNHILITYDADGQHRKNDLDKMLNIFKRNNLDLLIGSRLNIKRFSEKLFNIYLKKKFKINDIFCGLKIYKKNICEKYLEDFSKRSLGSLVALKVIKLPYNFREYQIKVNERSDKPRIGSNFLINLRILYLLMKEILS